MGFLSHRVQNGDIEAGEHIYTWRTGFAYSHHGIYVGENKVVHFTRERISGLSSDVLGLLDPSSLDSDSCSKNKSSDCQNIPDCGFRQPESGVVLSCMECFLSGGSLYRFEYGISWPSFVVKLRGGTCTTAVSDAADVVIHRAMHLLHNGFGRYNVFENNCEDFALYCKTGLLIHDEVAPGRSGQVSGLLGAPLAAILSSPLKLFMSSPIGLATAGVGLYCLNKYVTDIGVRSDVMRVEVEEMVSFKDVGSRKRMLSVDDEGDFRASKRHLSWQESSCPFWFQTTFRFIQWHSKWHSVAHVQKTSQTGYRKPKSGVVLSCLDCFLSGGRLYRCTYGSCILTTVVVQAQRQNLMLCIYFTTDLETMTRYTMTEDFALYCKTGLLTINQMLPGGRGQVTSLNCIGKAILKSIPLMSVPSCIGIAPVVVLAPIGTVIGAGLYGCYRVSSDIGVRRDVVTVDVADSVHFLRSKAAKP